MVLARNKPIVCPVLIGRAADLTALYVLVDQAKRGEGQGLANRAWSRRRKHTLLVRASSLCKGTAFRRIVHFRTPPFLIFCVLTFLVLPL